MSDFTDNMDAIVSMMNATPAINAQSSAIKTGFATWYTGLGWYDKNVGSDDVYNRARNFRDQFNLANAPSPEAKAQVQRVIKTGQTTEQVMGKRVQARTGSGGFVEEAPPEEPLIPDKYKVAAAAAGGVALVAIVAKKLHLI
jgi:hypothetical protein